MKETINNRNSIGKHNMRGSILIAVLIVLSSLIIISLGLTYRTRVEMKLAFTYAQRTKAYCLALGGIERTKALLISDELTPLIITQICQFHNSADEENLFGEIPEYSDDNKKLLSYNLRDEYGYLNLNTSDPKSWENLNLFDNGIYASILDWIDENSDISPDGAETDYYKLLENPYIAKNAPFVTLGELLFIKGVTRRIYNGEDLNRDGFLNADESDGFLKLPFDNEDSMLDYGLTDVFTVYGDGKININTASKMVISALPGLDENVAVLIERNRIGRDGIAGTADDVCITSPEEIALLEELSEIQISLLQEYCCYESQCFRVFSTAGISDTNKCTLMATIEIKDSELKILNMERLL
ncbi:MAG: general secretion pathway protein GspK [Bacteroidales bacterium]|nr:general secretion pathway protein GspK [Bacteroidales bacterium]